VKRFQSLRLFCAFKTVDILDLGLFVVVLNAPQILFRSRV